MSSGAKKKPVKMLSPEEISEALTELAKLAKLEGVRVALIGGIALQRYGSDRFTADVDLVAEAPLRGLRTVRKLSFGGVAQVTSKRVPVDMVVREDDFRSVYEEALDKAAKPRDLAVALVAPEYLVAMKMVAGRDKDMLDLSALLVSGHVDVKKARALVKRHLGAYAAKEFDGYLEEARWRANREGK